MKKNRRPLLSVGLPVYNGERYVKEALDSILAQTFTDYELIISDNASSDGTQDICRSYEARDRRITYFRNKDNLGAARNFNNVLSLSRGKYFKWIANDDLYEPGCLEKCISVLERDSSFAASYPKTRRIDELGNDLGRYELELDASSEDPAERFSELILKNHACFQIFAVMRRDILDRTGRFGNYSGADRVLISEVSLYGRFHEVPEYLFLRRSHPHESRMLFPERNLRVAWFDPSRAGKIVFSEWRILKEYLDSVRRSPLPLKKKAACYLFIGRLFKKNLRPLAHDLKSAGRQVISTKVLARHTRL